MGFWKNRMLEEEDRGWRALPGRFVCLDHLDDDALASHLEAQLEPVRCSYCDAASAAPVESLAGRLVECLQSEWTDPVNVAPIDGGEYVAVSPIYSSLGELLDNLDEGNPINSDELLYDLERAVIQVAWTQREFFDVRPGERLAFGWDRFSELVKHDRRFFFLQPESGGHEWDSPTPNEILAAVGNAIDELELIRTLPAGTTVYRGRAHESVRILSGADQLGPPAPLQVVSSNRMSPAGIAHFYAALSEDTALRETAAADMERQPLLTVGRFITSDPLRIAWLDSIPGIPSLFSDERDRRPITEFLHHFQEAITRPTSRDGREHVDYLPSQIVTEWMRTVFTPRGGVAVDGVAYPSSRDDGGINVALFFAKKQVGDQAAPGIRAWLADARTMSRPLT